MLKKKIKRMYVLPLLFFLDNNFSYGPYLCDGCYNIMQKSNNFTIVHVKKKRIQNLFSVYEETRSKNFND